MRLTVQSFQRKFDPTDPNVKQKWTITWDAYSTNWHMSAVASAFSNFASNQRNKMKHLML
jgi:hypothetical protein